MNSIRDIVFDPLNGPLIAANLATYFIVLKKVTANRSAFSKLNQGFILAVFVVLPGISIAPFNYFHPSILSNGDLGFGAVGILITYALFILIFLKDYRNFLPNVFSSIQRVPFISALLLFSLFSAFWSETPVLALRSSLIIVGISALAAHWVTQYGWDKISFYLRWSGLVTAAISTLLAFIAPSIAIGGKGWSGITDGGGNRLSILMAISVGLWLIRCFRKSLHNSLKIEVKPVLCTALCLLVAVKTGSATGLVLVAAVVTLLVPLNFIKRLKPNQAFLSLLLLLVMYAASVKIIGDYYTDILQLLGKSPSLTGRTDFWPQVIQRISERPVFGYGVNGFWQSWRGFDNPAAGISTNFGYVPNHSHNGFLDLGLQLGVTGIVLFVCSFLLTLFKAISLFLAPGRKEAITYIVILVFIVISNISVSELFSASHIWFYYVLTAVGVSIDSHSRKISSTAARG